MNSSDGNTHVGGNIPKGGCNGLMESAGNSNQKGDKEMAGQIQVWMVNWTGPGPGVRSTDLVLGQDKGPAERDKIHYGSGRGCEQTQDPKCSKGVYWGPRSNRSLLGKGSLE